MNGQYTTRQAVKAHGAVALAGRWLWRSFVFQISGTIAVWSFLGLAGAVGYTLTHGFHAVFPSRPGFADHVRQVEAAL